MLKVKREAVSLPFTSRDYCEVNVAAGLDEGSDRLLFLMNRKSKMKKGLSQMLQIPFTIVYVDLYLEKENLLSSTFEANSDKFCCNKNIKKD